MRDIRLLTILVLFTVVSCTQDKNESNDLKFSYVSDDENILSYQEKDTLISLIDKFRKETTNEIKVVTTSSISPFDDYNAYSTDLFNRIGIGLPEKNNGLLLTLSKKLKFTRLTTGSGTEKILTNEICLEIVNQILIPHFKNEKYYLGIKSGLLGIMRLWR